VFHTFAMEVGVEVVSENAMTASRKHTTETAFRDVLLAIDEPYEEAETVSHRLIF